MKNVSEWLLANKLSLNVAKSNFLIVRPHKNNIIKEQRGAATESVLFIQIEKSLSQF